MCKWNMGCALWPVTDLRSGQVEEGGGLGAFGDHLVTGPKHTWQAWVLLTPKIHIFK